MARNKKEEEKPRIKCADCKHFVRDTDGISRRNDTHEYFMGDCLKSIYPDHCRKVFAELERVCDSFEKK